MHKAVKSVLYVLLVKHFLNIKQRPLSVSFNHTIRQITTVNTLVTVLCYANKKEGIIIRIYV